MPCTTANAETARNQPTVACDGPLLPFTLRLRGNVVKPNVRWGVTLTGMDLSAQGWASLLLGMRTWVTRVPGFFGPMDV